MLFEFVISGAARALSVTSLATTTHVYSPVKKRWSLYTPVAVTACKVIAPAVIHESHSLVPHEVVVMFLTSWFETLYLA